MSRDSSGQKLWVWQRLLAKCALSQIWTYHSFIGTFPHLFYHPLCKSNKVNKWPAWKHYIKAIGQHQFPKVFPWSLFLKKSGHFNLCGQARSPNVWLLPSHLPHMDFGIRNCTVHYEWFCIQSLDTSRLFQDNRLHISLLCKLWFWWVFLA